ncbi:glutamine amidotransferase [Lacisediminihabitans sp. H27-G8]|uniref:glutamine amidotransferase n=1 Tax=Lacisediminihabitans sp. H27-G8 TaxID=3111909 RepID=UPI0038FD01DD
MPVALVLRHAEIAHLGNLEAVLRDHGYEIRYVDVAVESPHDQPDPDLVVVLGGDMGAYEKEAHPYLIDELDFLRERLAQERPTLGICLGAQLIAEALGETVRKGKTVEIGFREVTPTEAGLDSPLKHVSGVPMMQWHGDTFGLPSGAVRLASSSAYTNEAFALGDYVLAVQFHPELTADMHERWVLDGASELASLEIEADDLRRDALAKAPAMQAASVAMFSEWLGAL